VSDLLDKVLWFIHEYDGTYVFVCLYALLPRNGLLIVKWDVMVFMWI